MQIIQRFHWLPPLAVQHILRQYAKKPKFAKMCNSRRLVHQELLRYVNPNARINIKSDLFVHIEPADVHVHTNGDVLIAQLQGKAVPNCKAKLNVNISDDDKIITVLVEKLSAENTHLKCYLKVPIRADLNIDSSQNVHVKGIQCEEIRIRADGGISAQNLRAKTISFFSENGHISCSGTLLGQSIVIETHNGNINLDKLQGDSLKCITKTGQINTDSCYVEKSKFETTTGNMELKNVHKTSQVLVHETGELKMTGVHGNLEVTTKGGSLDLQLSQLMGQSKIVAQNLKEEAMINISKDIEIDSNIKIEASQVNLNKELEHTSHALSEDKSKFWLKNDKEQSLVIQSTGDKGVRLGIKSWMDMMSPTVAMKEQSEAKTST